MKKIKKLKDLAAKKAIGKMAFDLRDYMLGAVGIRSDGTIVSTRNEANKIATPEAHAEARLVKKLDKNSTVIVVRVKRKDFTLGLAKPCKNCQAALKNANVLHVWYSTDDGKIKKLW